MTHREQKVLHCVNERNATLSIISYFLLHSYRRKSQLQLIQYISELPVIISFGLSRTFYYFRLLEGRTTNQTPENYRIGSFDSYGLSGQDIFLFSETSRPALESIQSFEWVSGALYPGIMPPGYEAD